MEDKTLGSQIKKGAIISFFARYSDFGIQLFITAILSRILTPKDFGIVAIVTVIIAFFKLISDAGIGPAIIQYQDLNKDKISSIFNLTIVIGIILSIIFFFSGRLIANFYDNSAYILITRILSLV